MRWCLNRIILMAMGAIVAAGCLHAAPIDPTTQLQLIGGLYETGDDFRAETEVLRFLHFFPSHPMRGSVDLTRAKLYYRAGRYPESSLMLFSLLDRRPPGSSMADARRLLGLSLVRQGRIEDALALRLPEQTTPPETAPQARPITLADLSTPPPDAVSPEAARTWSTWLPGTGFFVAGEPGKAWAAMGLNLFLTGVAVAAWNDQLPGVALVFALAEIALYRGGRQAAYDAAQARLEQQELARRNAWSRQQGEAELLKVAFRLPFGGG